MGMEKHIKASGDMISCLEYRNFKGSAFLRKDGEYCQGNLQFGRSERDEHL
jgi:hypothetical protein